MSLAAWAMLLGLAGAPVVATPAPPEPAIAPATVDDEAAQETALAHAQDLLAAGRLDDALEVVDGMLAYYATRFPEGDTRWYVARGLEDSILYMAMATTQAGKEGGPKQAEAVTVQWANAWFLKGYILVELERLDEAEAALSRAVDLSPYNAHYLIELAEVAKLRRDWPTALERFQHAEAAAEFSPEELETKDKGQALRGQAFVHIERGDYDAAEKLLKACLRLDRNDKRAREELDYIGKLRAAAKP